jgi:cation diffusion facilitator family transporter
VQKGEMRKFEAALIAIIGGIAVFIVKLYAYFISNSVALLSDALESIVNIAASGLMLFAVYVSEKPADHNHDYGHQKIEDISRMLEGLFIMIAVLLIVYTAAVRLFESPELSEVNLAVGVSMLATAINAGLSWFLGRTARMSGSAALEGDSKHLLSDVVSSAGVWIGLFVAQLTGWSYLDSVLAFIVAALIARMGAALVVKSSQNLMEQSCDEEEVKIKKVFIRHSSRFLDFHDLKTRRNGNLVLAELHLVVDSTISVKDAHHLTDHLEEDLQKELPNVNVTIHIESK